MGKTHVMEYDRNLDTIPSTFESVNTDVYTGTGNDLDLDSIAPSIDFDGEKKTLKGEEKEESTQSERDLLLGVEGDPGVSVLCKTCACVANVYKRKGKVDQTRRAGEISKSMKDCLTKELVGLMKNQLHWKYDRRLLALNAHAIFHAHRDLGSFQLLVDIFTYNDPDMKQMKEWTREIIRVIPGSEASQLEEALKSFYSKSGKS